MPDRLLTRLSASAVSVLASSGSTICHWVKAEPPVRAWCSMAKTSLPVSTRKAASPSVATAKPERSR